MAMFPAFLDTCTVYGAYLCDSLLRLAEAGTYRTATSSGSTAGSSPYSSTWTRLITPSGKSDLMCFSTRVVPGFAMSSSLTCKPYAYNTCKP